MLGMSQKQSMSRDEELREFIKIASELKAQLDRIERNLELLLPIPGKAQGSLSQIHQHSLPVVE
jgi:hypothetical protein